MKDRRVEPLIVSFYTIGTPYEQEVKRLIDSCDRFGRDHHVVGVPNKGKWVFNCAKKGPFVRDQLEQWRRPVLWIDADGEVVSPLTGIATMDCDFACYVRWSVDKRPPSMDSAEMPFMSGTVLVNDTDGGRRLARRWADHCEENPGVWDQVCLAWAWWELRDEIVFRLLPQGYCKISDRIWREPNETPHILHHQASRRFKQLINGS